MIETIKLGSLDKLIANFKKFRPAATENNVVYLKNDGEFIMSNKLPMNIVYGKANIKHPIMDMIPVGVYLEVDFHMIKNILALGKTLMANVEHIDNVLKVSIDHIGEYEFKLIEDVNENTPEDNPILKLKKVASVYNVTKGSRIDGLELGDDFSNLFNSSKFSFNYTLNGFDVILHKKLFTTSTAKLKAGDTMKVELYESIIKNTFLAFYTICEKNCVSHIPLIHTSGIKHNSK